MKVLFFVFFLMIFKQSYSQYAFELNGTVPAMLNNKKLIFGIWDRYSGRQFQKSDTIVVRNNAFSIKGFLTKPSEEAFLLVMEGPSQKYFVIDSGKNTMVVHEIPPESITKRNKLSAAEMVNSKSNILKKKIDQVYYEDYLEEQRIKKNPSDSLTMVRQRNLVRKQFELAKQFSDTYYSLICLYSLSNSRFLQLDELFDVYNHLHESVKISPLGNELKERLVTYRLLEAGNTIKSFSAFTPSGETFSNELLKDTVYLLAFGATWCAPCKENIPMLKKLYNKFRDKNLKVLYVNLDGNEPLWKKQIAEYGVDWINVSDNKKMGESELKSAFNISAIPLYFIIDREQRIVYNSRSRKSQKFSMEVMEDIIKQTIK